MSQTPPKILLLDDDEDTLEMLQARFLREPYESHFASSGIDAVIMVLQAYKEGRPFDALILDCALPYFDGFAIARMVRLAEATGIAPRAKIGYFTAYTQTVERSTLLSEVGADEYWRKPEDAAELPALVAKWLKLEVASASA